MKKTFLVVFYLTFLLNSCGTDIQEKKTVSTKTSESFDVQNKCSAISKEIELPKVQKNELEKWGNAPDFVLSLINGNKLKLSENIGKIIILNFWATWCPPCRLEIPDFVSLYQEYKDKGLVIIGVSVDNNVGTVREFIQQNNVDYPVGMADRKVLQDYGGITGIPTTFIIDKKGDIVQKFIGYRPKEVFESEIKRLLPEKT